MASSNTTVTSAPDPSVFGESVVFTATVQPEVAGGPTLTGSVEFVVDGVSVTTVPLDLSGQAQYTTSDLEVGLHGVLANYSGDAEYTPSTGADTQEVTLAQTTTTLAIDPEPSVCGETVTFTAQVTPVPPGAGTPTGLVSFIISDDGPVLTAPVDVNGQAQVSVSDLGVGFHQVAVFYAGDTHFNGSNSALIVHVVNQAPVSVAVSAVPNPSVCGETVTLCTTVAPVSSGVGNPSGSVTFTGPGGLNETVTLDAGGEACVTTTVLETGTVTVSYGGDECYASATGTTDVAVNQASSAVSVSVDPSPSVCGETVTVCATVTAVAPGSGTPTGTVTFTGPGGLNVTVALDADGTACVTTSSLTSGTITAVYNGDGCFLPTTGSLDVAVIPALSAVSVSVDPSPSVCGETVTVCATVTAVAPGSGIPTGTITFTGPGLNETVTLDTDGTACVTTNTLEAGTVTALYTGDTCFLPSTGTSEVTVNQASSAVSVSVDPNPSVCGETVTVCATVTAVAPGSGTPTGTITFTGPGLNETVTLDADGTACITTTSLTSGTITAVYYGDGCFLPSTGTVPVIVNQAASTTTVSVTPNPSVCGESVMVCATVTAVAPGSGTPTGTITFTGPGGLNVTVALDADGTACITTTSLTSGTITAVYNGDGCFLPSTATADVAVNPALSAVSVSVDPNPSVCGETVTVCATVTAVAPGSGTPTGTITFTGPGGLNVTVALDADGTACITTTSLTSGTITAVYNGDGCFTPSTGSLDVAVIPALSAVSVSVDPNPSVCGETVTICATVTAVAPGSGTPTGTLSFLLPDGSTQVVGLDAGGTACLTTSTLTSGTVTAVYSGDGCFLPSTGSLDVTVNPASSTVSVLVVPNPSVCGETVTICATVTAVAPGSGTPTGTITFTGPGLNETVTLDTDGTACVTTSSLTSGTVTATYDGDSCFAGSDGLFDVTVNQASSTVSVLVVPNPSVCGETVTVCAAVTAVAPGSGIPTGTITFTGPGLNETVTLDTDGTACVTTSSLTSGTVTAVYSGDTCFTGSVGTFDVTVNQAASSTAVSVNPNPSVCGEPVTVCATVTAVAPGSGTPTGTITFTGAGLNETVTLDADGTACVTTTSLTSGTVTAVYNGDGCFLPSTGTVPVIVNQAASSTTVSVDPSPSVCGETVTVCATVTAVAPGSGTPTGTITFTGPGGLNTTVALDADGTACVTTSSLTSGTITAVYNGDGCFTPSTGTVPVIVNQAASTTAVSVTPNPSVCGETVTVCATVTAVAPGSGTPTGTLSFTGPGLNETVTLDADGTACATTTILTSGTYSATYNGDSCFAGSAGTFDVTVNQAVSSTTVSVDPNPSVCGESVTVCATVTAAASGTPTGTVTFTGPGLNTTVALDIDGTACVTTTTLGTGTVTAVYNGDGCFTPSTGTASVTVNPASSAVSVSVDPNPSVCGQSVTVCATVTGVAPGSGTPTGTVTFTGPGALNVTVALDTDGTACVTTTTLGTGTVTAVYNGDGCFTPSTGTAAVTVNQAASSTTVSVNPSPSVCGQSVTVCATVTAVAPGSGTPTGTITFTGPGGLNVTVALDADGTACVTTSSLTSGTITAVYNGDGCFTPSTGTAPVTVNNAQTTTALTVTPSPAVCGQLVTFCATVTTIAPGSGTPTGTVTFSGPGGFSQTVTLGGSGTACVTTTAGASGTVTAVYNGGTCHSPSAATANLTVNPVPTTLTAAPAQIRLRVNGTFVIPSMSATLKVTSSAAPLAGQLVTFKANTVLGPIVLGTALTNASGVATLAPPTLPVPSTVITASNYTASFAGTGCYASSSVSAPLSLVLFPLLP
ncbi:Ig-like domain-containing protein [Streptomyces sp. NPDC006430]|uniref:Ig-like domain-containing protein n=1 Tax=Streptomyces sp. NPDC006430 TaxID=3154299 RepID=UPI0033A083A9